MRYKGTYYLCPIHILLMFFILFGVFTLDIPWMMKENLMSERGSVYVGVNLCSANVFMPQHGLNGSQVCPTLQQRRSKRMSQRMGRDGLLDSRCLCLSLNHDEDHRAREM